MPDKTKSVEEIASNLVEDWTKKNKINHGEDCDSWIVVWHLNDLERMVVSRIRTERQRAESAEAQLSRIRLGMGDDYGDDPVEVINHLKAQLTAQKEEIERLSKEKTEYIDCCDALTKTHQALTASKEMVSKLDYLVDGASVIVELWKAESPSQIQWKKDWLADAKKVLNDTKEAG